MIELAKDPMLVVGGIAFFVSVGVMFGLWLASRALASLDENVGLDSVEEDIVDE